MARNRGHEITQASIEQRTQHHENDRTEVVWSNTGEVLRNTASGYVPGAPAYDNRSMWFSIPNGKQVIVIMHDYLNHPQEVATLRKMLEDAAIPPDKLELLVITTGNELTPYSPDLYESYQPPNLTNLGRLEIARRLTEAHGGISVRPMMRFKNLHGIPEPEWDELGAKLPTDTSGLDKAVMKLWIDQLEIVTTQKIASPGAALFHPQKLPQVRDRFPMIDMLLAADPSSGNTYQIMSSDRNIAYQQILKSIREQLEIHDKVIVKHAAGHSGVSQKLVTKEDLNELDERISELFSNGYNGKENFIIERAHDIATDTSGEIELGARATISDHGAQITSVHRQQVSGFDSAGDGGVYEGQIYAMRNRHLSDHPQFETGYNQVVNKFQHICDMLFNLGYRGPVNIDFLVVNEPQTDQLDAVAVDLNNLREGGSSASSNFLALLAAGIDNGSSTQPFVSTLVGETISTDELGLWDRDYTIHGNIDDNADWDSVLADLYRNGIYPYCTSTLQLEYAHNKRKLKLMVPFCHGYLEKQGTEDKQQTIHNAILTATNQILAKYNLTIH